MSALAEHAGGLLAFAGVCHFLQVPSMAYLRRGALRLEQDLARLTPINARLVRLFILAVMWLLLGLGASAAIAPEMWLGSALGRYLTFLLALFWVLRASSQVWLYAVWPRGRTNRALYYGLLTLYSFLAFAYFCVGFTGFTSEPQRIPVET